MKILFYIHGFSGGGAERVMTTIANHFHHRGDSVCVGCDTSIQPAYYLEPIKLLDIRDGCNSNNFLSRFHSYRLFCMLHNIRNIAKREKPDVIISFITEMNIYVLIALIGIRIPIIVCEHTNVTRKISWLSTYIRNLVYPMANAVTVLTRRDFSLWKTKFKNVVYMPNPHDNLRNDMKLNQKRAKIVLAAGRVKQWYIKGFDMLIKAWSNISKNYPDWELHIAGDADNRSLKELSHIVPSFEKYNIKFIGFKDNLHSIMASSSIFVLSSRIEGLPMVLIEAMNAGCCCISFDIETGPNEIIRHNYNGFLIPSEDINKLQLCLSNLIEDAALRTQLAARAPESMQKYSPERVMTRWDILLSKIVKTNTAPHNIL